MFFYGAKTHTLLASHSYLFQDKAFQVLDGDELQPYFDAIELEGNQGQPVEMEGVEEEKVSLILIFHQHTPALLWDFFSSGSFPVYFSSSIRLSNEHEYRSGLCKTVKLVIAKIFLQGTLAG